ncbi:MAG: phosphoglucosamine mutase [Bacteroidota bacterium]
MTLIKSISGIRGTIGGNPGEALTPLDIVKFTSAYAAFIAGQSDIRRIVIGRDARISGPMLSGLVSSTLIGCGFDVIDLDLSTTPTVEMAVVWEKAAGGIILTASHNPGQWNALKLLNHKGEFISDADGKAILQLAEQDRFEYVPVDRLGQYSRNDSYIQKHILSILGLGLVDVQAIQKKKFKVVVDAVNSSGGIAVPQLLRALGVDEVIELYCTPDGKFPHNPEPLPENLSAIAHEVKIRKADLGIVVDPDVDRLCFVCEDGTMFGEEYTLVAVADYVLSHRKGNTVSNLSSTRALRDITEKQGGTHYGTAVGEVNVVAKMKAVDAVIGGEGNGGIIYPELHYGRDALVGIALFLTHLANSNKKCSVLRASYPDYFISKNKIELTPQINIDELLLSIKNKYKKQPHNTEDGLKIEFDTDWIHLRRSNTEPIIRIYAESGHESTAEKLAKNMIAEIGNLLKNHH